MASCHSCRAPPSEIVRVHRPQTPSQSPGGRSCKVGATWLCDRSVASCGIWTGIEGTALPEALQYRTEKSGFFFSRNSSVKFHTISRSFFGGILEKKRPSSENVTCSPSNHHPVTCLRIFTPPSRPALRDVREPPHPLPPRLHIQVQHLGPTHSNHLGLAPEPSLSPSPSVARRHHESSKVGQNASSVSIAFSLGVGLSSRSGCQSNIRLLTGRRFLLQGSLSPSLAELVGIDIVS